MGRLATFGLEAGAEYAAPGASSTPERLQAPTG